MALSGSTNYNLTAGELILSVLRLFGIGLNGEVVTAAETNDTLEDLNILVKALSTKGLKLWLKGNQSVTLVAGDNNYTLGLAGQVVMDRPLEIESAYRRDSSGIDTPMTIFSRDEYRRLSDKTTSGPPVNLYHNPQLSSTELNLWPTPAAADAAEYTVEISWRKPADDLDNTTDDLEFPQEWYRALKWNLAKEAMVSYDIPESRQRRIEKYAKESLKDAEAGDIGHNTSVFFQPNSKRGR